MIIQSQNIAMQGKRNYRRTTMEMKTQTRGTLLQNGTQNLTAGLSGGRSFLDILNYRLDSSGKPLFENMENGGKTGTNSSVQGISNSGEEVQKSAERIQFETLEYLLYIFLMKGNRGFVERLQEQTETNLTNVSGNAPAWQMVSTEQWYSYQETETTTFSTQGKVVTADGREIEFGVEVGMSRSFYQEIYQKSVGLEPRMCDPLVINLDTDVANVSDQKFYFDLDCDGQEDEISMLGEGSGFLALDLNGDGKINDGSELFGTSTGNGFFDLAKYDTDGNGWIDEADEVFDRLRIWVPSADGEGTLYKLKDMGVGAICLQNVSTDFPLQNESGGLNGAIRRSGVFLRESGEAGTIQHVDLAM